jgi:hypothetical protein
MYALINPKLDVGNVYRSPLPIPNKTIKIPSNNQSIALITTPFTNAHIRGEFKGTTPVEYTCTTKTGYTAP